MYICIVKVKVGRVHALFKQNFGLIINFIIFQYYTVYLFLELYLFLVLDKQSVAFMAQLSANMLNPLPDTTVKFGSVVTNVGKGYDPDSGFFVAKVAGTYNFHLHAGSPRKEIESLVSNLESHQA